MRGFDVRQRVIFEYRGQDYNLELWPRPGIEVRLVGLKKHQRNSAETLKAFRAFMRQHRPLIDAMRPGNA
jgi:hypothetical protein